MNTNYRIVVGVDGSEGGERALRWAVHEAARRGGTVQAVTAFTFDGVDASSLTYRAAAARTDRADARRAGGRRTRRQPAGRCHHPGGLRYRGRGAAGQRPRRRPAGAGQPRPRPAVPRRPRLGRRRVRARRDLPGRRGARYRRRQVPATAESTGMPAAIL